MDPVELMRKVPFLAPASDERLEALARSARWRTYSRGEFLFHVGDPATRSYVVADGRVSAELVSPQGTPVMFHVAAAGEVAGLVHVAADGTHVASAQALSSVTALQIPNAACRELLRSEPGCALRLAADLADIIGALGSTVGDLVFLDLERRLARLLVESPAVGAHIHLSLTQSELAARLGVARQSLNRALAKLVERGLVAVESTRVIQVLDRSALRALVDSGGR